MILWINTRDENREIPAFEGKVRKNPLPFLEGMKPARASGMVRVAHKPRWERIGTIDHPLLKGLTAFSPLLTQGIFSHLRGAGGCPY
jgi:hypothetical protein